MGGSVAWGLLWVIALAVLVSSTMTPSKRKIELNSDDTDILGTVTSQSDEEASNDAEVEARPKPEREKEVVESSNTTDETRSGANSGPHVCRFCGLQFTKPQALGGHMKIHRNEKDQEDFRKALTLLIQRHLLLSQNPYVAANINPSPTTGQYYGPTQPAPYLQNPLLPVNQGLAAPQQNAQMGILQQGGPSAGAYYAPTDYTMQYNYGISAQGAANPAQQFYTPGINSGQTGYVDSELSLMQSGVDQCGQSIFHSNVQGGISTSSHFQDFSDLHSINMASNNQQVQSDIVNATEAYNLRQAAEQQLINSSDAIQFVDQHGNPALDNLPGHLISFPMLNESHEQELFSMYNALDELSDFPDDADQTTILVDSGQTSLETDTSIDDHNSERL